MQGGVCGTCSCCTSSGTARSAGLSAEIIASSSSISPRGWQRVTREGSHNHYAVIKQQLQLFQRFWLCKSSRRRRGQWRVTAVPLLPLTCKTAQHKEHHHGRAQTASQSLHSPESTPQCAKNERAVSERAAVALAVVGCPAESSRTVRNSCASASGRTSPLRVLFWKMIVHAARAQWGGALGHTFPCMLDLCCAALRSLCSASGQLARHAGSSQHKPRRRLVSHL